MDETAKWIELARQGSKDAFCVLVREYQARVRTFLARYVHNRTLVDDLAQETFLTAYLNIGSYDLRRPLLLWLLGIARHRALSQFRDEHNRRTREAVAFESTLAGWWAGQVESDESAQETHEAELSALQTCVKGLPSESAKLVRGYYFKSQSAAEIARESGKSENLVWVTMLRLRQALRRCVALRLASAEAR